MQMPGLGMGKRETDGGKGSEKERITIITVINDCGDRNPQAITRSLKQASVALTPLSWHSHINRLLQIRAQQNSAGERISLTLGSVACYRKSMARFFRVHQPVQILACWMLVMHWYFKYHILWSFLIHNYSFFINPKEHPGKPCPMLV